MGCTPEEFIAAGRADQQKRASTTQSDAEMTAHYTAAQNGHYENSMGAYTIDQGIRAMTAKPESRAALTTKQLIQKGFNAPSKMYGLGDFASPSTSVPQHIYKPVSTMLRNFMEQHTGTNYAQSQAVYRKEIVPPVKNLLGAITKIQAEYGTNPQALKAELGKLGLEPADVYVTKKWLSHVANGSAFFNFSPSDSNIITQAANNLVSSYVNINPIVLIGHSVGFIPRALAKYNPAQVFAGYNGAFEAAGRNPLKMFTENPELVNKGVYGNPFFRQAQAAENQSALTKGYSKFREITGLPIHFAQTFADNVAYHIGLQEGDPAKALKDLSLQNEPWDVEPIFQNKVGREAFALSRYHLNFTKMYGGMAKDLLEGVATGNGKQAGAALYGLTGFTVAQGLLLGGTAAVPGFIKGLLPQDESEGLFGIPLLSQDGLETSPSLAAVIRDHTGVNFGGEHGSPITGFSAGLGYELLNQQVKGSYHAFANARGALNDGDIKAATTYAIDGAGSLAPLFGVPQQAPKMAKIVTGLVRDEYGLDEVPDKTKEAIFGKKALETP